MPNAVIHFEIPFDDKKRAQEFYQKAFDWTIMDWPLEDGSTYVGVRTGEMEDDNKPKERGEIGGGMVPRDVAKTPTVSVKTEDAKALAAKAVEAGATLISEHSYVNVGIMIYIKDTEGNLLGLWESAHKSSEEDKEDKK
jgi:predicted enzyme related to lactoylglutathione lyase